MKWVSLLVIVGALFGVAEYLSAQPTANTGLSSQSVSAIALDPNNTSIVYAGTFDGVFRSPDGGLSWSGPTGPTWITEVLVDARNSNVVYVLAYNEIDDGLFQSIDGGQSWTKILDVTGGWTLRIHPEDSQIINVAAGYGDIGTTPGIFRTSDGGSSWLQTSEASIYSLAQDPSNPDTIYAGGRAILKSTNGGRSWTALVLYGPYPGATYINTLAIDPSNPKVIYAGGYRDGLLRSIDGGVTWGGVPLPNGPSTVTRLAMDPNNPGTLYAILEESLSNSLLKTTDGGATWTLMARLNSGRFMSLAIDPLRTRTLYVGTHSGVWKSFDAGATWSQNATLSNSPQWTPTFCPGSRWILAVNSAAPNSSIDLMGISKGADWSISNWRTSDSNGVVTESGYFPRDAIGAHSIQVEVNGIRSKPVSFVISDCQPISPS